MHLNSKIQLYVALIGAGAVISAAIIAAYWSRSDIGDTKDPKVKLIEYTGRVTDVNNNRIQNAKVIVEVDKSVQVQMTDSEGYFRVTVPEPAKSVRLRVEQENFESFDRTVWLDRTGVEPIQLRAKTNEPSASPSPTAGPKTSDAGRKASTTRNPEVRKRQHDAAIDALLDNRP